VHNSSIGLLFGAKPKLISSIMYMVYRLIAKYRPTMPVLSVVIPRLKTNQLRWSFTGAFEVHLFLLYICYSVHVLGAWIMWSISGCLAFSHTCNKIVILKAEEQHTSSECEYLTTFLEVFY
jgi:hypothetical protein